MMQKKIIKILFVILIIFILSITGYMIIERWSVLDALYMTVITLTTVGFMEVQPLSPAGRVYTIFILITGFSVILYGLGNITAFFIEGELMGILRRKKMEKKISKLDQHYIICGSGDMGKHVINEFIKTKTPFVVIERAEDEIETLQEKYGEILFIIGDASSDSVLLQAGIKAAKGLITTFSSDKSNLFVVLTARSLNGDLRIVARSLEEESEHKLRTAGADAVVSANMIGGMRIASEMLRPNVVSFLDIMLRSKNDTLRVEEAVISKNSKIEGKTIKDANIFGDIGLIIIAVKDSAAGEYTYNPKSNTILKENDVLIVLGMLEQISKLKKYTSA
jgi:voltage-gated potassium channel